MRLTLAAWGAIVGVAVAFAILAVLSVMLLNSGGANYKVLVAVWLWLLPVTGIFAGAGYAAGRVGALILSARRGP
jgi:hypothetical protein